VKAATTEEGIWNMEQRRLWIFGYVLAVTILALTLLAFSSSSAIGL
jgi:hypothetical protein